MAFDSVVLTVSQTDNGFFAMSDFTFGGTARVPEPATWAFMLIGFGGLGATTRGTRRQRATA